MCMLSAIALLAVFGVFRQVTRGPWTALALFVPFLALALFPWNDSGPFRNFDANYYGILPGRLFGPFLLAWLFAVSHPAADPDLGPVRLRRAGRSSTTSSSGPRRCSA